LGIVHKQGKQAISKRKNMYRRKKRKTRKRHSTMPLESGSKKRAK